MIYFISACLLSAGLIIGLFLFEEYPGKPANVGIPGLITVYLIYLILLAY